MGQYAEALGARLRAIRVQQGLSLHGVEDKSNGRWKAVVIGSYERGDRAVTAQRLAELAAFYRVPTSELLPAAAPRRSDATAATKVVIDLERLHQAPVERAAPLVRYAVAIQSQRGDHNGQVLSLRRADLQALSAIYGAPPAEVTEQLLDLGLIATPA